MPEFEFGADQLELARSDMKQNRHTDDIVKRASNKLLLIRRLKVPGAQPEELVDMFIKQCRSILQFAAPAWHGAITMTERQDIERVQKVALHIILGDKYDSYRNALKATNLETLETRRDRLCLKFGKKAEKNSKHKNWFKLKHRTLTRQEGAKYCKTIARTGRLKKSPITYN